MSNAISFYGSTEIKKTVKGKKRRVLRTRKDGVEQHYTTRKKTRKWVAHHGERLTVWGIPSDVAKVKQLVLSGWVPKAVYTDGVNAMKFLAHPEKFAKKGRWVKFTIKESP